MTLVIFFLLERDRNKGCAFMRRHAETLGVNSYDYQTFVDLDCRTMGALNVFYEAEGT